jgi:2-polyprenyl-6-hydroxyphenyl methylase / 3-demethylubiquinone-9 3-methyltransferase
VQSIDNDIYNRIGATWWEPDNPLVLLHGSITAARFDYFQRVLKRALQKSPDGLRALDIGSGAGFLAEEFARIGFSVVGVDPSTVAVEAARRHAEQTGLSIEYLVGSGESLPVPDESFEVVYCCDVLEHVADLEKVIAETARVLRPGGLYLFDTVNRTLLSRILAIKLIQEWRLTRLFEFPVHVWEMFITPTELAEALIRHDLRPAEVVGLGIRKNPVSVIIDFVRAKRRQISFLDLSYRLNAGQVKSTAMSYMGYATKPMR